MHAHELEYARYAYFNTVVLHEHPYNAHQMRTHRSGSGKLEIIQLTLVGDAVDAMSCCLTTEVKASLSGAMMILYPRWPNNLQSKKDVVEGINFGLILCSSTVLFPKSI